ncbi:hypothetical protein [Streptomyces sp. NPDC059176]|uniref:hypothetical protein n=1 Tax=Streptomyces sp. NPDC059176 TaxID=3346758 RepID=UPI0036897FA6
MRRFQLAGGVGTLPPVSRTEFDSAVRHWLASCLPTGAGAVVLLTRHTGWVLLDRAAATLRATVPVRAEVGPGATLPADADTAAAVQEILRTIPLRFDHTLLLARVDRAGAVHTDSRVLFPAGLRLARGETATVTVTVYGGVADNPSAALPVFCGNPAPDGAGAQPLCWEPTSLTALGPTSVTFGLRGPGEVTIGAPHRTPRELPPADAATLVRSLPRRIQRPVGLEVFLTVELSGADEAETGERLAFARALITSLTRHRGAARQLRIGIVGHYDHVIRENAYAPRPTLLLHVPAGPAERALANLESWRPAQREQDTVSSLEDALRTVVPSGGADVGSAPVRRVVLVVGRRPPAVAAQRHGLVPTCPLGADWRVELERLRRSGVLVMSRADPYAGARGPGRPGQGSGSYAEQAWAALAADGSFRPGADSPADVAEALVPAWRTDGPSCQLAFATPLL